MKLYADKSCWDFIENHPVQFAGFGCGPGGWGDWIVPDKIWGLSIKAACQIHDWYYRFWPENTEVARKRADKILLNNMVRIIDDAWLAALEHGKYIWWHKWLYKRRLKLAHIYYGMVRMFGAPAYFEDRNADFEYRNVQHA